jgi:hypothetical protein
VRTCECDCNVTDGEHVRQDAYPDLPLFGLIYLKEMHGVRTGTCCVFVCALRVCVRTILTDTSPHAGAFAVHIDAQLAPALEQLRAAFDDSMLVFVSDHGLHFGEHLETLEGQVCARLVCVEAVVCLRVCHKEGS